MADLVPSLHKPAHNFHRIFPSPKIPTPRLHPPQPPRQIHQPLRHQTHHSLIVLPYPIHPQQRRPSTSLLCCSTSDGHSITFTNPVSSSSVTNSTLRLWGHVTEVRFCLLPSMSINRSTSKNRFALMCQYLVPHFDNSRPIAFGAKRKT